LLIKLGQACQEASNDSLQSMQDIKQKLLQSLTGD